ncbi:MAG: class I SAM-dependent methyltransferase [Luteolibacter sp.]
MSFDRIAPFYRQLEALTAGGKLQRCRLAHLSSVPPPERILIAGEGNGRFVPLCARRFPKAEITVIDASRRMLEIARRRTRHGNIVWIHADILQWQPPLETYDLIVTHFFLDCFTAGELSVLIDLLSRAATPKAHWLLADFQLADAGFRKWRSRFILSLLYRFFHITAGLRPRQLVPPDPWLRENGFHLRSRSTYDWDLLKSELWAR